MVQLVDPHLILTEKKIITKGPTPTPISIPIPTLNPMLKPGPGQIYDTIKSNYKYFILLGALILFIIAIMLTNQIPKLNQLFNGLLRGFAIYCEDLPIQYLLYIQELTQKGKLSFVFSPLLTLALSLPLSKGSTPQAEAKFLLIFFLGAINHIDSRAKIVPHIL